MISRYGTFGGLCRQSSSTRPPPGPQTREPVAEVAPAPPPPRRRPLLRRRGLRAAQLERQALHARRSTWGRRQAGSRRSPRTRPLAYLSSRTGLANSPAARSPSSKRRPRARDSSELPPALRGGRPATTGRSATHGHLCRQSSSTRPPPGPQTREPVAEVAPAPPPPRRRPLLRRRGLRAAQLERQALHARRSTWGRRQAGSRRSPRTRPLAYLSSRTGLANSPAARSPSSKRRPRARDSSELPPALRGGRPLPSQNRHSRARLRRLGPPRRRQTRPRPTCRVA